MADPDVQVDLTDRVPGEQPPDHELPQMVTGIFSTYDPNDSEQLAQKQRAH
jgi:hypothetical protein